MNITAWIDDRLEKFAATISWRISADIVAEIKAAETNLQATIVSTVLDAEHALSADIYTGVDQVVAAASKNATDVIDSVGSTVTDSIDHFTIDTSSLAQAVAQAIKGLLPPFLGGNK